MKSHNRHQAVAGTLENQQLDSNPRYIDLKESSRCLKTNKTLYLRTYLEAIFEKAEAFSKSEEIFFEIQLFETENFA